MGFLTFKQSRPRIIDEYPDIYNDLVTWIERDGVINSSGPSFYANVPSAKGKWTLTGWQSKESITANIISSFARKYGNTYSVKNSGHLRVYKNKETYDLLT